MNKSLKIFIACFLGAGIGTLTALQLNGYFWWVGLLVGALVGYFSYEFKKVKEAAPKAWNTAKGWKPNKKWWRDFGSIILPVASISSTCIIGFLAFFAPLIALSEEASPMQSLKYSILAFSLMTFATMLIGILVEMLMDEKVRKKDSLFFKEYNPFRVYLWLLPKYIVLGLIWLIRQVFHVTIHTPGFIWKVIVTFARFIKTLFIMIHSEIRLLCGIDAAIGAAIGFFAGSVIIGAVSGGLFGLLNYEILSKRILHLVPSRTNNA